MVANVITTAGALVVFLLSVPTAAGGGDMVIAGLSGVAMLYYSDRVLRAE